MMTLNVTTLVFDKDCLHHESKLTIDFDMDQL